MPYYDTPIPNDQLYAYSQWLKEQGQNAQRPVGLDQQDYDIQGMFMDGGTFNQGHGLDTYKKPNHPTFSDQSKYNGILGLLGGQWNDSGSFKPGETNLQNHTPMQLYNYFQKQEPDVMLSSPDNGALSILSYLLTKGY